MRVLVTGGSGRVGRFIVSELAEAGHEVTSLDFAAPGRATEGVRYMQGDVSRMEDVYGTIAYVQAEAVVHMAAWANPGMVPDSRTYADNTAATFNVLDASLALGVGRVLSASSAQVYGFAGHAPFHAPVDEEHPLRPLNSYALSKIAGEGAAAYFAGKGLNVLSLRIMGVRAPETLAPEIAEAVRDPAPDRFLLWTRTDARDIAIGCRKALEAERVPSGVYNMTGSENVLDEPTADLFRRYSPETEIRGGLTGTASGLSCAKARAAFGYEPRFPWSRSRQHPV